MYIKGGTRDGYNASNCLFLWWLDKKRPDCVSEDARKATQETFQSQHGATVKHKNTVMAKA